MSVNARRAIGVVVAVVVASLVWLLGEVLFDLDFEIEPPGQEAQSMSVAVIAIGTLVVSLLAWLVAVLVERFVSRPRMWWLIIGAIPFIVFNVGVFIQTSGASTTEQSWIVLVHLVVAAILVWLIGWTLPARRSSTT